MQEDRIGRKRVEDVLRRVGLGKMSTPMLLCAAAVLAALLVFCAVRFAGGGGGTSFTVPDDGDIQVTQTSEQAGTSADETAQEPPVDGSTVIVDVAGNVVSPGVYELSGDSRVIDAVNMAGGLTDNADAAQVNLARKLVDGEQVYIPAEGEAIASAGATSGGLHASSGATGAGLVNINVASESELMSLTGIGEVTAGRIVEDREQNGPFESIEDLKRVSGIGDTKFDAIRGSICV